MASPTSPASHSRQSPSAPRTGISFSTSNRTTRVGEAHAGGWRVFYLGGERGVAEMAAAKIAATPAIRITDLSRRTRGIDLKPLNGPGACLIGVGVVSVSTKIPWGLQWLLNFIKNLPK